MKDDILDKPVSLHYNNGSSFPESSKIIGYAFLGVGTIFTVLGSWYLGIPLILFGCFICFTRYGVKFDPKLKQVTEYTNYLGVIPKKKTTNYSEWGLLTVIPLKISTRLYSKSVFSTTVSNYYFTICLIGKNYRSKKELIRLDNKSTAEATAKALCYRLGMDYFEYDPEVIRKAFRG